jgi:hypothetical protein
MASYTLNLKNARYGGPGGWQPRLIFRDGDGVILSFNDVPAFGAVRITFDVDPDAFQATDDFSHSFLLMGA